MAPSKQHINEVFSNLTRSDPDGFFAHVDPNVEWTVQSRSTLGGTYHSAASFRAATFARLRPIMDPSTPMSQVVTNVIGGGEGEEWCTVEMVNEGKTRSEDRYDQTYAWCCRWALQEGEWRIVQVRAYLDTGLVDRVVAANEK